MLKFILRETFRSIKKAKLYFVFSLITTAIGIFLIQASLLSTMYINDLRQEISRQLTIQVYVDDSLAADIQTNLQNYFRSSTLISRYQFISKDEAESLFVAETGENFRKVLSYNPLPASYELTINTNETTPAKVDSLIEELRALRGVSDVGFEKEIFRTVLSYIEQSRKYIIGTAAVLTAIALYIIFAMSIVILQLRKKEMKTMKLVGSSSLLIRAPILFNGFIVGLLSNIIAVGMWYVLAYLMVHYFLGFLPNFSAKVIVLWECCWIGPLIGVISSLVAVIKLDKEYS